MTGLEELSDLELQVTDAEGNPPISRVKNVEAAKSIFKNLCKGDEASAINRARVQGMFDGASPYSSSALRASNQGFRTNLNFGEGEKYLEQAMAAYVDLINGVEQLVRVETTFGDPKQRVEWSRIMSEEYSFQIRKWDRFNYEYLNLCNHFVGHGVGINYFEDEYCWYWRSTGLGDVLVPRKTQASEQEIDVATAKRSMQVTELFSAIEEEDKAAEMGWNVEEVKKAIREASAGVTEISDWEEFQKEVKNNDLYMGGKAAKVHVVHMWVKEFNGTVTHLIFRKDGEGKFLYKRQGRYENISQAFTFFTYGIGTNGTYHSIRGLGFKIYQHMQLSNRIRSQAVDNAMLAGSPMVQPEDERALENMAFNYFGPFAILPPNVNYVDRAFPNVSQTMMPVLDELTSMADQRTGQYSTQGVFGKGKGDRRTRFEVAAHLEESSKLSGTALNLFYSPWDRHHVEVARRFHNPEYPSTEPGYDQIAEYRERCVMRGVPEEALMAVDVRKTKAVRAVGNGSSGNRMVQLQQLNELAGTFDAEGRHNLFRDQTAAIVGADAADRYIPAQPDQRMPQDAKIAQLENKDLLEGGEVEIFPNEIHIVHLDIHVPELEKIWQAVEEGQIELIEAYQRSVNLFFHCVQHLEFIQQDPTIAGAVAQYNERLQQVSELISNGEKALAKAQREAEEAAANDEAAQADLAGQPQISPEQQEKMIEHRLKLQMMQEKHEMEIMIKLQKAQQDRALQDLKAGQSLQELLR